ncbi:MAG: bacterial Ig-like domain-containing protein [Candidatus Fimenecus sp.]
MKKSKKVLSILLCTMMIITSMPLAKLELFAVTDVSVESISVPDVSVIENTHGYLTSESVYNAETDTYEEKEYYYYNDFTQNVITVNFADGSSFTGTDSELYEQYGESMNCSYGQCYSNRWTVGNTYSVTVSFMGISSSFNVTITQSPVESIEISDISVIENTHGNWSNEWIYNEETGTEEKVGYYRYSEYTPNEITVNFKDGSSYTGAPYELQEQYGEWVSYSDNQSYENQWTVGNTYPVTVSFMGISSSFNVTITQSPVESLEVADNSVMEGTHGYWSNEWIYNEETGTEEEVSYFFYNDYTPNEITVNFKDGSSFTGATYELQEQYGESVSYSDNQSYENQWTAGNTYSATVSFMGISSSFNVTITQSPVESIEISDISVIENTHGYWSTDWIYNEETDNYEEVSYYRYNDYTPNKITVNFKDGSSFTGAPYELQEQYSEWVSYSDNQSYENQWTVGNTYPVTASFMGCSCVFNVSITESPVESIEIADISVTENTHGYWRNDWIYNEETGTSDEVSYYCYNDFTPDEITVNFKDGSSFTGTVYELYNQYGGSLSYSNNQSYENQWTAGNTYPVTVSYLGCSGTFNVSITESAVVSVEAADVSVTEGANGYWSNDWVYNEETGTHEEVFYYRYNDFMPDEITVNFADGSSFTGTEYELYKQYGESVSYSGNQGYENQWTVGNTYPVTISFMGCSGTFNVTVMPSVIAGLSVDDAVVYKQIDESLNGNGYKHTVPITFSVLLTDGRILPGKTDAWGYSSVSINGDYFALHIFDDNECWDLGTRTVSASIGGKTDEFNVEVKDTLIKSIEVQTIELTENLDCSSYEKEDGTVSKHYYYTPVYKVYLSNGKTIQSEADGSVLLNGLYRHVSTSDNQEGAQWGVGTHEYTLTLAKQTVNGEIVIKECPYTGIELYNTAIPYIKFTKAGGETEIANFISFEIFGETYQTIGGELITDKGVFDVDFTFDNKLSLSNVTLKLGAFTSNTVDNLYWLKASYMSSDAATIVTGFENKENINVSDAKSLDLMIKLSINLCDIEPAQTTAENFSFDISEVETAILNLFDVSSVDITKSSYYSAENNSIVLTDAYSMGDGFADESSFSYENGQYLYSCTCKDSGYTVSVIMNSEAKIREITFTDAPGIVEFYVENLPAKTTYNLNGKFSLKGLVVKGKYADGTVETISDYSLNAPNMTTPGAKEIVVSYKTYSDSFYIQVQDNTNASLAIGVADAAVGSIVRVPVRIQNADISALVATIAYDSTKLEYVGCINTMFDSLQVTKSAENQLSISANSNSYVSNGIFILEFRVAAESGCNTALTPTIQEAYDEHHNAISLSPCSGGVSIINCTKGDVDRNGVWEQSDYDLMKAYVLCEKTLARREFLAADLNCDGAVDAYDVIQLDLYLNGLTDINGNKIS